jgi:hypothetical protein
MLLSLQIINCSFKIEKGLFFAAVTVTVMSVSLVTFTLPVTPLTKASYFIRCIVLTNHEICLELDATGS